MMSVAHTVNGQESGNAAVYRGLTGVLVDFTAICEIDNETDNLRYRGYDIEDLIQHCSFEDVANILLYGELPTVSERAAIVETLQSSRDLPGAVYDLILSLPVSTEPMSVLRTAISALGCFDAAQEDDLVGIRRRALRLTAQVPTIVGAFEAHRRGVATLEPLHGMSHAAHVLQQFTLRAPDSLDAQALDKVLTLHGDHELNASCFSARVTASTLSNLTAAVTSAIGTLSGSLHGGANERVLLNAQEIGVPENAERFIDEKLGRKEKIHGFGQRGCAGEDPRAVILRGLAQELVRRKGDAGVFDVLTRMHDVMSTRTRLWPNVDFYSASVLHSLGIARDLFTPLFAASRIVGWSAHVVEQLTDNRLIRPKAKYIGPAPRSVAKR